MPKNVYKMAILAVGLALGSPSFAATPSAEMLAETCAGCHGPEGNSAGPAIPTIAGISSEFMVESMNGFKNGDIPSTIMGRIAKGYSEEEIKAMATYFAKQTYKPAKQDFDPALADKGAKRHKKYCEKCHEDGGTSAEDDSGILAGQWQPYLRYTMSDFLSGAHEMPKKMKKKVDKLREKHGDDGIEQLMHFYARGQQ